LGACGKTSGSQVDSPATEEKGEEVEGGGGEKREV